MTELGWNQAGLAVASAVNPATLSRFFSGKQELDVPQLAAIARSMGLQPGDLLDRSQTDPMADRLDPVIARLRPLRIEDQIRAVSALASNLDFMLGWKGEPNHSTVERTLTYNQGNSSGKTDGFPSAVYGVGAGNVRGTTNVHADDPRTAQRTATSPTDKKPSKRR